MNQSQKNKKTTMRKWAMKSVFTDGHTYSFIFGFVLFSISIVALLVQFMPFGVTITLLVIGFSIDIISLFFNGRECYETKKQVSGRK